MNQIKKEVPVSTPINGYEQTYIALIPRIREVDFKEAASRLGLVYELVNERASLNIQFLGIPYIITPDGVTPKDDLQDNVNNRSVLIYYILSKVAGNPIGEFCQLHTFAQGLISSNSSDSDWMTDSLCKKLDQYEKFTAVMDSLGGSFENSPHAGEYIWFYQLLPKVPVKIVYYEADEEFPAAIKIMYDKSAAWHFEFEPLAFLNGCLVTAMSGLASDMPQSDLV